MDCRKWLVVLATVALFALAACGGDDDGDDGGDDPAETFISDADAICADAVAEGRDAALAEDALPADEADLAAVYEELIPRLEDTQAQLEALEPPSELSAGYDEFLSARQERIDLTQKAVEAQQGAALDDFNSLVGEIGTQFDEVNAAGAEVGFAACGNVMSDEGLAEVEAREQEVAEATDPSVICEEFYLPQFVEAVYPDEEDPVAACIDDPNSAKSVEVDVSDVLGVDDVVAYATVEFPGEKDPGPFLDTLYYVDGEWKLYNSGPAE